MFDLKPIKIGFLPANRGFFSQNLASQMREQTLAVLAEQGVNCIVPSVEQTTAGCVESRLEALLTGRLFHDAQVDGILVGAMNFGDEQAVAVTLREAGLNVPVMIFGCQESDALHCGMDRRDSFCGLLSIADVLRQIDIPYSIGKNPICWPTDDGFINDLNQFMGVCRVVKGIRTARYAQIGTRPDAFWTCRYDEKRLQRLGPTVVTLGLTEMMQQANDIAPDDPQLQDRITQIKSYGDTSVIHSKAMLQMARLELFLQRFAEKNQIDGFAIQCWTSLQEAFGVCACTAMSRLSELGTVCACEADVMGAMSMHALQLASGTPAALADWNNLHHEDPDLVNLWHCGAYPKSFALENKVQISVHSILVPAGATAEDDSHGVVQMQVKPGPTTLCRVTESPDQGFRALLIQAAFETRDEATEGAYGWCRIGNLSQLYRRVLLRHYPHHVAMTQSHCADILHEAFDRYLKLKTDRHEPK